MNVLLCGLVVGFVMGTYSNTNYYTILGISSTSSEVEVKRAYRQLALELHPDKLRSSNLSEEELEKHGARFLLVQEAYETLGDKNLRRKYDYSLEGIQYDILDKVEIERYKSKPFSMFVKTETVKIVLTAEFKAPEIPILNLQLNVAFGDTFKSLQRTKSFFRRILCPDCKGMGGVCRQCVFCNGTGVGLHYYSSSVSSFEQATETACASCSGTGCKVIAACARCNSSGFVMEEDSVTFNFANGVSNGYVINLEGRGHETQSGRGLVAVTCVYDMPADWTLDGKTGNVIHTKIVPLDVLLDGYSTLIACPSGEFIEVAVSEKASLVDLVYGLDIVGHGMGAVVSENGSRSNLIVHVEPDWSTATGQTISRLLEKMGYDPNDESVAKLVGMVMSVDGIAKSSIAVDQEDINIASSH